MPSASTNYNLTKPTPGGDADSWGTDLDNNLIEKVDGILARHGLPRTAPVVGATTSLDLSLSRVFVFTVSQDTTVNVTNFPSVDPAAPFVRFWVWLTTSASFTPTFTGFSWSNSNLPNFKQSGTYVLEVVSIASGTYLANIVYSSVSAQMPLVRVYNSANQVITTDSPVALTWDTAQFDTHTMFSAGSPTRLTIPTGQGGTYRFIAQLGQYDGGGECIQAWIKKNGSTDLEAIIWRARQHSSDGSGILIAMDQFIAGDYVELRTDNFDGTADYTIFGGSSFTNFFGERIR